MNDPRSFPSCGPALATAAAGMILLTAACETPASPEPYVEDPLNASVHSETAKDDLLKAVRRATARYHSPVQAIQAGYEPDEHCVEVPGVGGMGHHWANLDLVDPVFDPLRPEAVLYAPGSDGDLQLVAVEYIVIDVGQDAPSFGEQPFDVGGTPVPVPHWSLHVWLYADNPEGVFVPFNPEISCL